MKRIITTIVFYITVIASLLTISKFFKDSRPFEGLETTIASSSLALIALIFLLLNAHKDTIIRFQGVYLKTLKEIQRAHIECTFSASKNFQSQNDIKETARGLCDLIKEAFSIITGTRCAVSIVVLMEPANNHKEHYHNLEVYTLVRDKASSDRDAFEKKATHFIDQNTEYGYILDNLGHPNKRTFCCNNLPAYAGYHSSLFHKDVYSKPPGDDYGLLPGYFLRLLKWTLPYKSTIVSPIYPLNVANKDDLNGFLRIECKRKNVFRKRIDPYLVCALGSALHPLITNCFNIVVDAEE